MIFDIWQDPHLRLSLLRYSVSFEKKAVAIFRKTSPFPMPSRISSCSLQLLHGHIALLCSWCDFKHVDSYLDLGQRSCSSMVTRMDQLAGARRRGCYTADMEFTMQISRSPWSIPRMQLKSDLRRSISSDALQVSSLSITIRFLALLVRVQMLLSFFFPTSFLSSRATEWPCSTLSEMFAVQGCTGSSRSPQEFLS